MYYNSMGEAIHYRTLSNNGFFDVMLAGQTNPNPSYRIVHNLSKNRLWNNYVFEYVIDGKGYIETETDRYEVSAGDTYFLNKLQKHTYYADKKQPYTKQFLVLHGSFVDNLVSSFGLSESVLIRKINTSDIFEKIFLLCGEEKLPLDDIMCKSLEIVQRIKPHDYRYVDTPLKMSELIKNYLDENIAQKITLDDISHALNLSKSHIERLFAEEYHTSPLKYFSYNKINYACTLVINTNYTLGKIADVLSFGDPKYLSKCIKAATGMSPSALRKSKEKHEIDGL